MIATIERFVNSIEDPTLSEQAAITSLRIALDHIAILTHNHITDPELDYPEAPEQSYTVLRQIVAQRFPSFGLYSIPTHISTNIADTHLVIGDAIDDCSDILIELKDVLWYNEHVSFECAAWEFQAKYEQHFAEHLANLRWYLHHQHQETSAS